MNSMMQSYMAANPNSLLARSMGMQGGITSFAAGGMVTPTGGAIRPGAGMNPAMPADGPRLGASTPPTMTPQQIEQEAKTVIQKNPQLVEHVRQLVAAAIQDGSCTPEELNMMVQLAKAALANPASYPQIRQFAIQNGLGSEAEVPQEFDPGLVYVLMVIGQSMQGANPGASSTPQGDAMQGQKPAGILPEYEDGGMTGNKKHVAVVHPREYIVPEKALLWHGKKKLDAMVQEAMEAENGTAAQ